ncbi:MAG: DUF11 domain-containing protein [Desulfuromonadales bacterium]|nr:DUF11 domain-containing protein [Desulfuromonadales bacterium]
MDCSIVNYPQSNPLITNFSFFTNPGGTPERYFVIFDNVYHTGNMSCNSSAGHKIWFANSSYTKISESCQNLFIPVETIDKRNPEGQSTAAIGVPFTYTLTLPSMNFPFGAPSGNDLHSVILWDDLTTIGADLTFVGINAYYKGTNTPVTLVPENDPSARGGVWSPKNLSYKPIPLILKGDQVVVEITVVLDDTLNNSVGKTFINLAKWWFGRAIDVDDNGVISEDEFFEPLPGWWGITLPMTIAGPELVVTKTSDETALNLGIPATFTIDVQNSGGSDAWRATILDQFPDGADAGMCDYDPRPGLSARVVAADGTLAAELTEGADYSLSYTGPLGTPACQLAVTLTRDAGPIAPEQHLIITYQTQLDSEPKPQDGITLINVAGATRWFSSDGSYPPRAHNKTLTDGTPTLIDHQDSHVVTTALSGYYFQKTVQNLTSHVSPATTAAAGDQLRYKLRLFNVDQTITGLTILDPLDLNRFDATTFVLANLPAEAQYNFDPATGLLVIDGGTNSLDLAVGDELVIEFDITLKSSLVKGDEVVNQASFSAGPLTALSDDPYVNGIAPPGTLGDPTRVVIQTAGPLSKENTQASATIGEPFRYLIKVPAERLGEPLYDVRIVDDLNRSAADLRLVSARVVSGGPWVLANTGSSDTDLVIEDTITGIDIPANGQAIIEITLELLNTAGNNSGLSFSNSASYSYNRRNGDDDTQTAGGEGSTAPMTVVEPAVTATKSVRFVTPAGKPATDPALAGDVVEYGITLVNGGTSTAFATNVTDTLPSNAILIPDSATAQINGVAVAGFVVNPTTLPGGALAWGRQNEDRSLDIPAGQSLVLTYRATVASVNGVPIVNSVYTDWTSFNGASTAERTGEGCPSWSAPNDYCFGPAVATVNTLDSTSIVKTVVADSWESGLSHATDAILRVGDSVTYQLTLNVREGETQNLVVTDTLPAGLVFDEVVSLHDATTPDYTATEPFSYSAIPASRVPAAGATGTLSWNLGTIFNVIDHNPGNDTLVIRYRARVATDTLAHTATTQLINQAALSYAGGDPAAEPGRLTSSASIEVRQPVLSLLTKTGTVSGPAASGDGTEGSPFVVDVLANTMDFNLVACNSGEAPAYGVAISDQLAAQFDHQSLGTPVVSISGFAGTPDYTYVAPTIRGGEMLFTLGTPLDPSACVAIRYSVGFHDDIPANQLWSNRATVAQYWSLPPAAAQEYAAMTPVAPSSVWMTNTATIEGPVKSIVSPAGEATIGEIVVYQITVPGTPINAALHEVVVTDLLDPRLVYLGASTGDGFSLTDLTVPPGQVTLSLPLIPAGQQAVIELRARIGNSAASNGGDTFSNTASFTYGGSDQLWTSEPTASLTIVEPLVTVAKTVTANDSPAAGHILTYTLTLQAATGANHADAYDLTVADILSPGLGYVAGSARLAGVPVEPVVAGGGPAVPQTLGWSGFPIPEGETVILTYDVRVLDSVLVGQLLGNQVTARWTSLEGDHAFERDGSGEPTWNDYVAQAEIGLIVGDATTFAKGRLSDSWGDDGEVRVGDLIDFELRLGLQEGTHAGLIVTDTLPAGLVFEEVVSANFFGTPGVATATLNGQTLTWNLGNLVNPADNDPGNDFLVIVYRVRVLNESALPQTDSIVLTNSAILDYTRGGIPAPRQEESATITVLQPRLSVSKSSFPAEGSSIGANQLITYTVDISNSGTAPAYDTVLVDQLPVGLRQGGVTTTAVTLVGAGTPLSPLAPEYSPESGVATWNFDAGSADLFTIPAGETLRLVYQVTADSDLGPGLTLTNAAQATHYYSFDNAAVPANGSVTERQLYGPSDSAHTTLTSPLAGALLKETTQAAAAIGEPFSYRLTIPASPVPTALHDVWISDDLAASGADLRFLSARLIAGGTLVNTGSGTNVILGADGGIDIPANAQIEIEMVVELLDTGRNLTPGLTFVNSAWYSYSNGQTRLGEPLTTGAASPSMRVVHPQLTVAKTGPATMRVGLPDTFTLEVRNVGEASAWNLTLTDRLPDPTPGGLCDTPPAVTSALIQKGDGTSVALTPADYAVNFVRGGATCEFTVTMGTASTMIAPADSLRLTYEVAPDVDNLHGATLTNVAGATGWFSADASRPERHLYAAGLTDGTPAIVDHQDAHEVLVEAAVLVTRKTVANRTSGESGANASPGDRLRYSITIENSSEIPLSGFTLRDELDRLNAPPMFQPGSLTVEVAPAGAELVADGGGGLSGSGTVEVRNLAIGPYQTLTVEFEATLVPVIGNSTVVLNQGELTLGGVVFGRTDDPAVAGDQNPTETRIASAPLLRVEKTVDQKVVYAGQSLRYTITVKNVGDEDAAHVVLRDEIPANTTYVANSTTLNGVGVDDLGGSSPLAGGEWKIYPPGSPNPGELKADPNDTAAEVAVISFDVLVSGAVGDSTFIANQAFVTGTGSSEIPFPEVPSDDPSTEEPGDPTRAMVLQPNGIVYDSVRRTPMAGATLTLLRASTMTPLPASCFNDPAQQSQITPESGAYKFDLNFSQPECPAGGDADYLIVLTAAGSGYVAAPSQLIPPTSGSTTAAYPVPVCPADALPATDYCEAQVSARVPANGAATTYYQHLTLNSDQMPQRSQIFHNHIPVDPELEAAIAIAKTTPLVNVTRGQLVPYTITVKNTLGGTIPYLTIVDDFPAGFKYVEGSSRFDGQPLKPVSNGRQLRWENLELTYNETHTLQLLLVVGSGVSEGEYTNRAQVINTAIGGTVSAEATATVRVVPDPDFDCTDVIGKVYDDRNLNAEQDPGELGLAGVRLVTARGLIATTDEHGRFHITCAVVPEEDRGSNFILKLDDRTLPTGYRLTSENPRVQRATRGKMLRFNFGATIHRVVGLDIADGVFEPQSTVLRLQWEPRIGQLVEELKQGPAVLRLAYLAEIEEEKLVRQRLAALKKEIARQWQRAGGGYRLTIETDVFWRRGGPPGR